MTAYRSHGTTRCRARAATVASRIGQSTGALLIPAGLAPPRPGHHHGARAGLPGRAFVPGRQGTGGRPER